MSKAKLILSAAALIGFSGIVACSHSNRRSDIDAQAIVPPSVSSGTTTEASNSPADLGASTSGRGL